MVALLLVAFFVAVLIGLGIAFGGFVLAIMLALAGLLVLAWAGALLLSRRSVSGVVEEGASGDELLGPGGPDDPGRP